MKTGVEIIQDEYIRQTEVEGYTAEHDDQWTDEELAQAAATYVYPERMAYPGREDVWPQNWDTEYFKPTCHLGIEGRIRELAKAGALIGKEIDRLNRLQKPSEDSGTKESPDKYINGKIQVDFDQFGMP